MDFAKTNTWKCYEHMYLHGLAEDRGDGYMDPFPRRVFPVAVPAADERTSALRALLYHEQARDVAAADIGLRRISTISLYDMDIAGRRLHRYRRTDTNMLQQAPTYPRTALADTPPAARTAGTIHSLNPPTTLKADRRSASRTSLLPCKSPRLMLCWRSEHEGRSRWR